jgi:hypothetical protein
MGVGVGVGVAMGVGVRVGVGAGLGAEWSYCGSGSGCQSIERYTTRESIGHDCLFQKHGAHCDRTLHPWFANPQSTEEWEWDQEWNWKWSQSFRTQNC